MRRLPRIADLVDGSFLAMGQLLTALRPAADDLSWQILDIGDVIADDDAGIDVGELERRVFESPTGLGLSFAELSAFADGVAQVIDGLFVGCAPGVAAPQRDDSDVTILARAETPLRAW